MHVSSCATILLSISLCTVSLFGVIASTSSKNNIQGASFFRLDQLKLPAEHTFASSNVSLSVFSDSPDIPETIDGADTEMNGSPNS